MLLPEKSHGWRSVVGYNPWGRKESETTEQLHFPFFHFVWITTNGRKFFKRWEYQTTLSVSQETCIQIKKQVRTGHGTPDWFKIVKRAWQGCTLSPCLLSPNICRVHLAEFWAEWITTWNQDFQKNYQNLRYADDTTLMKLKSLLMKVKEETEKAGLKLNV